MSESASSPLANKPIVARRPNGQLLPGYTPNPSGRPKGLKTLSAQLLAKTKDGRELIEWWVGIWRGHKTPLGKIPTPSERFEAAHWIADHAWGKAPAVQIDVTAPSVIIVTAQGDVE